MFEQKLIIVLLAAAVMLTYLTTLLDMIHLLGTLVPVNVTIMMLKRGNQN